MGILLGSSLPHVWAHKSWSSDEFERLIDLSVFGPEERLELIGGELIPTMTQNGPHSTGIILAQSAMLALGLRQVQVRVQLPLRLGPHDRPEPDVALVRGGLRDFAVHIPTTALLVIEVSDATLAADRTTKASMYARAGIQEYWIANIPEHLLEVHREPVEDAGAIFGFSYSSVQKLGPSESIAPLAAPGGAIPVSDLLV